MRSKTGEYLATGVWLLGMLLATGVSAASLCFAWRYGMALGGSGSWSYVKPTVLVGQDAFKFVLPSLVIGARRRGKSFLANVGSAGFVGLSALSIWSIFSVEVLDHAALVAARTTGEKRLADLESDLARTEARLKLLGEMRPVGTVEAEIAAQRHDRRWAASNGCTEVKNSTRAFCATYNRLFGELAGAQEAASLRTRLDDARNKIASARSAPVTVDAELQLIETLFGVEAGVPVILRALTLAIVLELAGDFFFTLVLVNRPGPSRSRPRKVKGPRGAKTPPRRTVRYGAATGAVDGPSLGALADDEELRRRDSQQTCVDAESAAAARASAPATVPDREEAGEARAPKPCPRRGQMANDGRAETGIPEPLDTCPGLQRPATLFVQPETEDLTAREERADQGSGGLRSQGARARSTNSQYRCCSGRGTCSRGAKRDAHCAACETTPVRCRGSAQLSRPLPRSTRTACPRRPTTARARFPAWGE